MAFFLGSGRVVPAITAHIINNQSKSGIIPSTQSQIIKPDIGYTGLGQVTVEAIPSAYVLPSGTYTVTNSGTYNIKQYKSAFIPYMVSSSWNFFVSTKVSIDTNGLLTCEVTIPSGFNDFSSLYSSYIVPHTEMSTITIVPSDTSQVVLDSQQWVRRDVIIDAIPSSITVYKKIYEKNPTDVEANFYLNTVSSTPQYFLGFCSTIQNISASTITSIASWGFCSCSKLATVNFPNLISLGASVFQSCSSLISVSLPQLTTLLSNTFSNCKNLTSIYLPNVTRFNGEYNFGQCYNLSIISLPELTYIYGSDFQYCSALETISFPKLSIVSAYSSCFYSCKNLKSVYLMNSSMVYFYRYPSQNWKIFDSSPITHSSYLGGSYASIYVPMSLLNTYQTDSGWMPIADRFVGI